MRVIRGLAALVALLAGVLGLPAALVALRVQLAPALTAWSDPVALLRSPDPVALLLALLLLGAWVAWLVFVLGVLGELVAMASGHRLHLRLPGLASAQQLAAGLLVSVVAMLTTTPVSSADPAPPMLTAALNMPAGEQPESAAHVRPPSDPPPAGTSRAPQRSTTQDDEGHVHVVVRGEDLWSLAQHYYGSGSEWRRIAKANPDRLTGGPDRLTAGWRLVIPGVTPAGDGTAIKRDARPLRTVEVRRDDTLSAIAERFYGAERRWPILWEANRHQLDDPDELTIGMELVVPYRKRWEGDRARQGEGERQDDRQGDGDARAKSPTGDRDEAGTPRVPARTKPVDAEARPADTTCIDRSTETPSVAPVDTAPVDVPPDGSRADEADDAVVAAAIGSAGALLAAAVIAGLAMRRRQQLQTRPVGRRILQPTPPVQAVETALGHRARPASLRTLDLALRAISAHCHRGGVPLPSLTVTTIADQRLELRLSGPPAALPSGFRANGDLWVIDTTDVAELKEMPGLSEAVRPYPALVTLGADPDGHPVVADLEGLRLLRVRADDPQPLEAAIAAMALELSFSPWAEEMIVTSVGSLPDLPEVLGQHNVTHTDDIDALLDRCEARAAVQRDHLRSSSLARHRVDPDLADPWAPEILLINRPLDPGQEDRLRRLLTEEPRVTMAAVVPWTPGISSGWTLRLHGSPSSAVRGVLEPLGLELTPQLLERPAAESVLELARITGSGTTTAAPWWSVEDHIGAAGDPDPPAQNVNYLSPAWPQRFGGWADRVDETELIDGGALAMTTGLGTGAGSALHPTLLMLGPVELVAAAGPAPTRAAKQCLEYCGWLLENPGTTANAMAAALVVAEGTRRSNVSRLRSWLGSDEDGTPYLPDAYTGRIMLKDVVSSDWQRLQLLTARGINRASTDALRAALALVRGAPLADAAPGQWHWAEELRTDMISAVRDLGVELTARALDEHDIDLARWAAARALVAAPGDELLLVARIRTEHQAGHHREVERLTLRVAAQARQLGVDLAPETVTVLQEVLEGRARARLA